MAKSLAEDPQVGDEKMVRGTSRLACLVEH